MGGPRRAIQINVAIRSLMIEAGAVTLNAGCGVVWDSTALAKYEEALWKTRFTNLPQTAPA